MASSTPTSSPPRNLLQLSAFVALLGLAFVMPLVPVSREAPMDKHVLFAALAGAGALLLWVDALRGRLVPTLGTPVDWAFYGFLAAAVPSVLVAINPGMARIELGNITCFGITYLLAIKTLRTPRAVWTLYAVVLAGALIISAFGLEAYGRFLADEAPDVRRSGYLSTSLFPHSYLAAQYVVMVFCGGVVLALERSLSVRWRIGLTLLLLPIGTYLLVIGSRGAYLAVFASLVVSAVLRARAAGEGSTAGRLLRVVLRASAVLAALALVYTLASVSGLLPGDAAGHALERLLSFFDPKSAEGNFERLGIWRATLAMVTDNLLTGVGLGCYATGILPYQAAERVVPHAHNQFLQALGQSGLIGLIGLLFLVRHAVHAARKGAAYLVSDDARRGPFHAAVAGLMASFVYFFLETPLHWLEAGSLIIILLAIMSRAGCMNRDAVPWPAGTHLSLLIGVVCIGIAVPGWRAFHEFSLDRSHSARLVESARAAWLVGDEERAQYLWDESEALLEHADGIFPHSLEAVTQGSEYAWSMGHLERAVEWQTLGNERFPHAPFQLYKLGSLLLQLGRTEHSIPLLREVAQRENGENALSTTVTLARAYSRAKHYEAAWFLQKDLVDDPFVVEDDPALLLDAVSTLLILQRELLHAQRLLDTYVDLVPIDELPDGQRVRYDDLRSRLEEQLVLVDRPLLRGDAWDGWLEEQG